MSGVSSTLRRGEGGGLDVGNGGRNSGIWESAFQLEILALFREGDGGGEIGGDGGSAGEVDRGRILPFCSTNPFVCVTLTPALTSVSMSESSSSDSSDSSSNSPATGLGMRS